MTAPAPASALDKWSNMHWGLGFVPGTPERTISLGSIAAGAVGGVLLKGVVGSAIGAAVGYAVLGPAVGMVLFLTMPPGSLSRGPLAKPGEA